MANRTAPCRVCGKQFIPCNKSSAEIGAFNYREVACSFECGKEYLRRVVAGRNTEANKNTQQEVVERKETLQVEEKFESVPVSVVSLEKDAEEVETTLDDIEM